MFSTTTINRVSVWIQVPQTMKHLILMDGACFIAMKWQCRSQATRPRACFRLRSGNRKKTQHFARLLLGRLHSTIGLSNTSEVPTLLRILQRPQTLSSATVSLTLGMLAESLSLWTIKRFRSLSNNLPTIWICVSQTKPTVKAWQTPDKLKWSGLLSLLTSTRAQISSHK